PRCPPGAMEPRAHLQCKNLQEFLRGLSPPTLDRLYGHPATCLAVFRELPGLAQAGIMRMLFLEQPLPQAAVGLWVKKENSREQQQSQEVLLELRLWHPHTLPGGLPGVALNPNFRQNLRVALLGGVNTGDKFVIIPNLGVTPEVLGFFLMLPPQIFGVSSEGGEPPCITSAGFQFLLLDTPAQLWFFILQYLRGAEARGMDLVEILSFLFQLSFSTLGKDYSVEGMSESLLTFLQHLREFGLVFQRKRKSRRFYPTRLAIALASGTSGTSSGTLGTSLGTSLGTEPDSHGFVLVETNYRIYAYTDSELQVALIALFSELLYRFPNLVVAQVTRDSVQAAIANGITAEQIIHFLRTRAHPVMAKQSPVLPPTITDQIRLWELERDRLRFSDGVLYNQFLSQVDFEVLRDHARALGVLVFENPGRRLMVVTPAGHPDVKRFWKRQKHNG
ncbi:TF2H4 factor, partial [Cinclus mexicanus]|nr:TF2H4 factor [Cinclus mexicanus]